MWSQCFLVARRAHVIFFGKVTVETRTYRNLSFCFLCASGLDPLETAIRKPRAFWRGTLLSLDRNSRTSILLCMAWKSSLSLYLFPSIESSKLPKDSRDQTRFR